MVSRHELSWAGDRGEPGSRIGTAKGAGKSAKRFGNTQNRDMLKVRRVSFDPTGESVRLNRHSRVDACIGLCHRRQVPSSCLRCWKRTTRARGILGVPTASSDVDREVATAHARFRAIALSHDIGTGDCSQRVLPVVWRHDQVLLFGVDSGTIHMGCASGRLREPSDSMWVSTLVEYCVSDDSFGHMHTSYLSFF